MPSRTRPASGIRYRSFGSGAGVSPSHGSTVEPVLTFPSLQRYWNSIPWPSPRILYAGAPPWDVD